MTFSTLALTLLAVGAQSGMSGEGVAGASSLGLLQGEPVLAGEGALQGIDRLGLAVPAAGDLLEERRDPHPVGRGPFGALEDLHGLRELPGDRVLMDLEEPL